MVSFEVQRSDGETTLPWGRDVGGTLMYAAAGRFSVQCMQNGTEKEIHSVLGGYVA